MSKMSRLDYDLKNKIITRPTRFCKTPAIVTVCEYAVNLTDKTKAIVGLDPVSGVQLWNATVNLIGFPPSDGCVWIKEEARKKGLMSELIRLGVISFNSRFTRCKEGYLFECRLLV